MMSVLCDFFATLVDDGHVDAYELSVRPPHR